MANDKANEKKPAEKPADAPPPAALNEGALASDIQRLATDAGTAPASPAAAPIAPAGPSALELETRKDLRGLLVLVGMVGAPNWNIQPEEYDALAEGGARVLLKYWPDGMGTMGPEMGLGITLLAIAAPRMAAGLPLRADPPKPDQDKGDKGAASGG